VHGDKNKSLHEDVGRHGQDCAKKWNVITYDAARTKDERRKAGRKEGEGRSCEKLRFTN
jgi:hypothetical protein